MADSAIAKQLCSEIEHQRQQIRTTNESVQFPEYRQATVEHFLDLGIPSDEILSRLTAPEQQRSVRPNGISNPRTLEKLRGSQKQVAWASSIRDTYAKLHPHDENIYRQLNASWWIENHRGIDAQKKR